MSHDGNVRACYLPPASLTDPGGIETVLDRCARLGFSSVVLPCPFVADGQSERARLCDPSRLAPGFEWTGPAVEGLGRLTALAAGRGLAVFMDVRLDEVDPGSPLMQRHPEWFRPHHASEGPLPDPRQPPPAVSAVVRWRSHPHEIGAWWQQQLEEWCEAGVAGFRCLWPQRVPADAWTSLIRNVQSRQSARFWAWTPGLEPVQAASLAGCGFDAGCSSLAWWDFRSPWFFNEDLRLRDFPSVIAVLDDPQQPGGDLLDEAAVRERSRLLRLAATLGDGVLARFDPQPHPVIDSLTVEMNRAVAGRGASARKGLRPVLGGGAQPVIGCLLEALDGSSARLVLANADSGHVASADMAQLLRTLADWRPAPAGNDAGADPASAGLALEPAEVREMPLARPEPVRIPGRARMAADKAAAMPRIAIEGIEPAIDAGRFPIKRIIGEPVRVQADVFCDGHDLVTATLLWRPLGQRQWQSAPMRNLGNDRWAGEFTPARLGRHEYVVEAWRDEFATARMDLEKRLAADKLSALDLDEVCLLVSDAASASGDESLRSLQQRLQDEEALPARAAILLEPGTASAMARAGGRPFLARSPATYLVDCERQSAGFSSWYELFPRSQSPAPEPGQEQRHGTFDDVIGRLPAIRQMGFDVLYMPPIHPIGRINRKGRNNSVTAEPGEPGSPYAIGASEGGHDAIHPELGTLEDFRKLVSAAAGEGLELALDFAIQCSPDHPWLREHPDWFAWRADGSIRYAENPPKRYEDIVNVDFYAKGAVPELWTTLRDVVAFWVNEGVRLFRVDNPHTKPFPFWEWMFAEIHATHPDVVFLSEAFTRPKLMYRLAKVGFSQSYTYFTWRNSKAELTDYLTELADGEPSEFFRPHFFVNTPDINPVFLQTSGRPGHLIRAALATTLAGLWGMYSGFELCDATPLKPGKEEYLDSEKYQLRHWNWRREGDIVDEIARLNQLRRLNPALQTHLGIRFYNAFNDNILYFGKRRGEREDMILVAINLDPHNAQEADFELPLWEWGLPDHGSLVVEDLWRGTRSVRQGKHQHIRLDPAELPFAIWRVGPPEGAHA